MQIYAFTKQPFLPILHNKPLSLHPPTETKENAAASVCDATGDGHNNYKIQGQQIKELMRLT